MKIFKKLFAKKKNYVAVLCGNELKKDGRKYRFQTNNSAEKEGKTLKEVEFVPWEKGGEVLLSKALSEKVSEGKSPEHISVYTIFDAKENGIKKEDEWESVVKKMLFPEKNVAGKKENVAIAFFKTTIKDNSFEVCGIKAGGKLCKDPKILGHLLYKHFSKSDVYVQDDKKNKGQLYLSCEPDNEKEDKATFRVYRYDSSNNRGFSDEGEQQIQIPKGQNTNNQSTGGKPDADAGDAESKKEDKATDLQSISKAIKTIIDKLPKSVPSEDKIRNLIKEELKNFSPSANQNSKQSDGSKESINSWTTDDALIKSIGEIIFGYKEKEIKTLKGETTSLNEEIRRLDTERKELERNIEKEKNKAAADLKAAKEELKGQFDREKKDLERKHKDEKEELENAKAALKKALAEDSARIISGIARLIERIKTVANEKGFVKPCGNNAEDCNALENDLAERINKFSDKFFQGINENNNPCDTINCLSERLLSELDDRYSWIYAVARYRAYSGKRFMTNANRGEGVCFDKGKIVGMYSNLALLLGRFDITLILPDVFEDTITDYGEDNGKPLLEDATGAESSPLNYMLPNSDKYYKGDGPDRKDVIKDFADIGYIYKGEIRKRTKILR